MGTAATTRSISMPSLKSLMTPSVHELQQFVLVGFQLLERLALDARDHSCDKPDRSFSKGLPGSLAPR